VNSDELRQLQNIRQKAGRLPSGLTPKNLRVLRQLDDAEVKASLVALPMRLADQARRQRMSPARRVQRFQIALAIELLLVAPMRLQNLSALRFDRQLSWPAGPGGELYIVLEDDETKNSQPLEYQVPASSKALLEEYRDRYRPILHPGSSPWLFVREGGVQMAAAALRDGITKAIRREIGIDMTPHQFRHFAAQILLTALPGSYPMVMDLLGHKNLKTTTAFYSGRRSRQAGQVYDELLRKPLPTTGPTG
jgi:integrase